MHDSAQLFANDASSQRGVTTLTTALHTAHLHDVIGVLILPSDRARVCHDHAGPGLSLADADMISALAQVDALGFAPSVDEFGEWDLLGHAIGGRPVIALQHHNYFMDPHRDHAADSQELLALVEWVE